MRLSLVALLAASLLPFSLGGAAQAAQFTPGVGDQLNVFTLGPGTPYNTPVGGADYDQIGSADPHPGELVVTGSVPVLNYNNAGSPQSFGFSPALSFSLEAELLSADLTTNPGALTLNFGGTADGQFDLVVTDPFDASIVLQANLVSGSFDFGGGPTATPALQAILPLTGGNDTTGTTLAFFKVSPGSLYASLFPTLIGGFGLNLGAVNNFQADGDPTPDFDQIVAAFNGTLPSLISNNADAFGEVYALNSSQFQLPEPGMGLLTVFGLIALVASRTRAKRS